MNKIRFYISPFSEIFTAEIHYILRLWAINQQRSITFVQEPYGAISIGGGEEDHLWVEKNFHKGISSSDLSSFNLDAARADHLALCFSLINSVQEFGSTDLDDLNRFKFKNSFQHKSDKIKENLVQALFDKISLRIGQEPVHCDSRFFLSHDIDLVYGAIVEDGFNVLKKGRIDLFLKMLFDLAMKRPAWLNMDKIMAIESEYDCRSIFFWIVNKGKVNDRERNADYNFNASAIRQKFESVHHSHFENGIHKSISAESFDEELQKYGERPLANRYHYLKFTLPQAYHDIEQAKLKLDASLGFAEEMGFRNSYGLPFNPYNFTTRMAFKFVEAPLHVMDRTFFQYKKYSPTKARHEILEFFEKNRKNCVLSVLWHNNFFTDYKFKGYLQMYKDILSYIKDNNFRTITAAEIVKKYSITE